MGKYGKPWKIYGCFQKMGVPQITINHHKSPSVTDDHFEIEPPILEPLEIPLLGIIQGEATVYEN